MTRMTLRRLLTAASFLALILGGAAVPAAAAGTADFSTTCWYTACGDPRL